MEKGSARAPRGDHQVERWPGPRAVAPAVGRSVCSRPLFSLPLGALVPHLPPLLTLGPAFQAPSFIFLRNSLQVQLLLPTAGPCLRCASSPSSSARRPHHLSPWAPAGRPPARRPLYRSPSFETKSQLLFRARLLSAFLLAGPVPFPACSPPSSVSADLNLSGGQVQAEDRGIPVGLHCPPGSLCLHRTLILISCCWWKCLGKGRFGVLLGVCLWLQTDSF